MGRRQDRRRRRERRLRAATFSPEHEGSVSCTPVNWSRLCQVFGSMTHRGHVVLRLVFLGVVVERENPAELVANTERELVRRTRGDPGN